jgi:hypothetical protein
MVTKLNKKTKNNMGQFSLELSEINYLTNPQVPSNSNDLSVLNTEGYNTAENQMLIFFTEEQLMLYNKAKFLRSDMLKQVRKKINWNGQLKYRNLIISGNAGLGKTNAIEQELLNKKVKYFKVGGKFTLLSLTKMLCKQHHDLQPGEICYVFIDDGDMIFQDETNCNFLKQAFSDENAMMYEVSTNYILSNLEESEKEIFKKYTSNDRSGIRVSTEQMVFVITTNTHLPSDKEIDKKSLNGSRNVPALMKHRHALRNRCKYIDISLEGKIKWGWVCDVAINTDCLKNYEISKNGVIEILSFLWENFDQLTECNIRTIEKMAITKNENPTDYKSEWVVEFTSLKS